MTKKKNSPSHLKIKEFSHPGKDLILVKSIEEAEYPRGLSFNFKYSLTSILFMTIVSSLCGG